MRVHDFAERCWQIAEKTSASHDTAGEEDEPYPAVERRLGGRSTPSPSVLKIRARPNLVFPCPPTLMGEVRSRGLVDARA